jgi:hypothetical protein
LRTVCGEVFTAVGLGAHFMTVHDLVHDLGRPFREGRLDRPRGLKWQRSSFSVERMPVFPAGR